MERRRALALTIFLLILLALLGAFTLIFVQRDRKTAVKPVNVVETHLRKDAMASLTDEDCALLGRPGGVEWTRAILDCTPTGLGGPGGGIAPVLTAAMARQAIDFDAPPASKIDNRPASLGEAIVAKIAASAPGEDPHNGPNTTGDEKIAGEHGGEGGQLATLDAPPPTGALYSFGPPGGRNPGILAPGFFPGEGPENQGGGFPFDDMGPEGATDLVTPLPAGLILMATGLFGLLGALRRK